MSFSGNELTSKKLITACGRVFRRRPEAEQNPYEEPRSAREEIKFAVCAYNGDHCHVLYSSLIKKLRDKQD